MTAPDRRGQHVRPALSAMLLAGLMGTSTPAFALSEIQDEEIAPPPEVQMVPLPPPLANPDNPASPESPPAPDGTEPDDPDSLTEQPDSDIPIPTISYDIDALPEAVKLTRSLILDAAKRGDIDALRPLIAADGDNVTQFSLGGIEGDPIDFLREMSGDDQGHEILAILQEVLEAGYVLSDIGTENEIYLWPYFFAVPLDRLTAPQRVELFRLVTAGDYEDMKNFGAYIFYRAGIRPDGSWAFFVAGD